tara:strand:- start:1249 stop:1746 length:498 start_codon:yes stop_codon:yes gene_type:complete
MNKKENLKLINKNISSEDAINIAKSNNMFGDAFNIGESFYPYFHFQVNYQAPFLLARKQLKIDCLIDGLNGQAATSDIFLLKNIEAYSDDILNKKVNRERAQISGKRYVINSLSRKFKSISNFNVIMNFKSTVYKSFWVIEYENISLIVDSINGSQKVVELSDAV